jgi:hypothetical protein
MKRRKTFLLSEDAIARPEQFAARSGKSVSPVIEEKLLGIPLSISSNDEFWPGPALQPKRRTGDAKFEYLKRKHDR